MLSTFLFILLFSPNTFADKIDTTIVRKVDVTGDGIPDSVCLYIQANNPSSVYSFKLSIYSKSILLYSYAGDDSKFDDMFTDEYFPKCSSKIAAKNEYYFKTMLRFKTTRKMNFGDPKFRFDPKYSGSIYRVAGDALTKRYGLSDKQSEAAIKKAIDRLKKGKAIIVYHADGILESCLPLIYFPEVKKLIPIYNE